MSKEYGVEDVAKKVGVETSTVRVAFRKHKIKKNGSSYIFTSEKDMAAAIKKCWPDGAGKKKPAKKTKPAKKAKKKSASRKAKPADAGEGASA